ncbi:MAG: alkaline phosphatase family protein [Deltaproteobacteria bacterium]|nr:alkaline phosphatase family protein [Deltaproteobacteria bacterium]
MTTATRSSQIPARAVYDRFPLSSLADLARSATMVLSLGLAVLIAAGCGEQRRDSGPAPSRRVVLLGFDGVDPDLVEQWRDKLPNISKMMDAGTFRRLQTTTPPASCTAWSSFTTGLNPGGHGIFDFILRDPKTYLPDRTGAVSHPAEYRFGMFLKKPETFTSTMSGQAFWTVADRAGKRSVVLRVPCIYPLEELEHGYEQGGLGVPDMRGSEGTFHYWSSDLSPRDAADPDLGGKVLSLANAKKVETVIEGPTNPLSESHERLTVALKLEAAGKDALNIEVAGRSETVEVGRWSDWFRIGFQVTPLSTLHGMARFRVLEVEPNLRLYLSPINHDPADPAIVLTQPPSYSKELQRAVGDFKTVGWNHETWGLNEERIDEEAFMQDIWSTFRETEAITMHELEDKKTELLISVFVETDRTAHMMYRLMDPEHPAYDQALAARYGDSIQKTYQRMDEIVGKVVAKLGLNDVLLIISDHGFHSWRRGFNVNSWLIEQGFMTLKGGAKSTERKFLQDVDWSKTQAYALGVGGIYINQQGREGKGIVKAGKEAERVAADIASRLRKVVDPKTSRPVVSEVYLAKDTWKGGRLADGQDMQIGMVPGYRVSSATPLGGAPEGLFEDNKKKWSGDHATSQTSVTEGILLSNLKVGPKSAEDSPSILDLAPTILTLLGVPVPPQYDGRALAVTTATGGQ